MDRNPVQEDLYEFNHLPGSTPGTYWRDVRAVIARDAEARDATPSPKGFPPIAAEPRTIYPVGRHTPGHHGDSPIPPQGLPPINENNKQCSTSRPPDTGQNQLFFKKTDFEQKQVKVLDKLKLTNTQIHRGLIEAVEEPSAWKIEKKKRIENAIERVNNNYVVHPRNYQEPDINERVDSQFMPSPPKGPRPKPRKHNRVILNPEKMLRDRDHMRGDFVPGRPPGHVPESSYRRAGSPMPSSSYGRASTSTFEGIPKHVCPHHGDAYENVMPPGFRPAAPMPNKHVFDQGRESRDEQRHRRYLAQERIQQEYVDELRMEDETPTSSQAEIDMDIKRQKLLARKGSEKKKKAEAAALKHAELLRASRSDAEHTGFKYVPAPPPAGNANVDSYAKRKRHLVYHTTPSAADVDTNVAGIGSVGVEGFKSETEVALIPRTTRPTHGPVIRVEPQLTWNASAAKRGLGFKSKLRREQEEAALQNKGHGNNDDAQRRGNGMASPSLSEDARRRWKNKTIYNQR